MKLNQESGRGNSIVKQGNVDHSDSRGDRGTVLIEFMSQIPSSSKQNNSHPILSSGRTA